MATTRNIQMQYFNGTDYDTLYPENKCLKTTGGTMTGNISMSNQNITNVRQISGSGVNNSTNITLESGGFNVRNGSTKVFGVSTSYLNANSHRIINVSTPTGSNDAVNKSYVDNLSGKLDIRTYSLKFNSSWKSRGSNEVFFETMSVSINIPSNEKVLWGYIKNLGKITYSGFTLNKDEDENDPGYGVGESGSTMSLNEFWYGNGITDSPSLIRIGAYINSIQVNPLSLYVKYSTDRIGTSCTASFNVDFTIVYLKF